MLTDDEKRRLYMIRASINKAEVPSPDTVIWLIEKIGELDDDAHTKAKLMAKLSSYNVSLRKRVEVMYQDMIQKVREVFDTPEDL